jgi:hypothetical protein
MKFPSVAEYEDTISLGKKSFKTLDVEFDLSNPAARIWTFGVGQFAVVFKAKIDGDYYAIRCFQHATKKGLENYSILSDYLKGKKFPWLSKFIYYDNEITVGSKKYPVLVMDWVEGIDIHDFITENLHSNYWLLQLQKSLISLSDNLEKNGIGHGDFQKGNVIVIKENKKILLKLIDYDGMFVTPMSGQSSIELGKPDIQHPKREKKFFNEKLDRFSIWLIITAIEALKYNKTLWDKISEGGFNDGSNFLFRYEDLHNTTNSKLFSKLLDSPNISVKEYATQLRGLCNGSVEKVLIPKLLDSVKSEEVVDDNVKIVQERLNKIKELRTIFGEESGDVEQNQKDKSLSEKKQKEESTKTKKGGKEFDTKDNKQNSGKSTKTKKGGKEFDTEDVQDKSNTEKLAHTIRLKNMFLGLFVLTSILSIFLIFSYNEKLSDYFSKDRQYNESYKSGQSLKENLDEMTEDRDKWQNDYYTMESNRDSWRSDYYSMKNDKEYWYNDRERVVRKWNSHVNSRYCYTTMMCSCY